MSVKGGLQEVADRSVKGGLQEVTDQLEVSEGGSTGGR